MAFLLVLFSPLRSNILAALALAALVAVVVTFMSQTTLTLTIRLHGGRAVVFAGRHYFWTGVGSQLANLDTVAVGVVAGPTIAAIYGLPSRMTAAMLLVSSSLATVLLPDVASAVADRDVDELGRIGKQVALACVGIAVIGTPAVVFARPIVVAAFGAQLSAAADPLRVIVIAMIIGNSNVLIGAMLQGLGYARGVARISLAVGIAGLVLIAFGARVGGALGGAISLATMQGAGLASLLWLLHRSRRSPGERQ